MFVFLTSKGEIFPVVDESGLSNNGTFLTRSQPSVIVKKFFRSLGIKITCKNINFVTPLVRVTSEYPMVER